MSSETLHDILTASLSDVGMVRAHNEDCCDEFRKSDGCHLLVMADGMGGHQGGATASRTAVETIGEVFEGSDESSRTMLHEAVVAANRRVYGKAIENDALRGMGTTVVALVLAADGSGWIAHVGDSRGYRLRQGKIEALTADHSVVGEMLQQGLLTRDEAAVHPRRNQITRSVGVEAEVEPEISEISTQPGDRFLLCSDGLSGLLDEEEIALVLIGEPPSEAVRILVDEANARGGHDNITVQIAAIGGDVPAAAESQVAEPTGGAGAATSNEGKAAHAEERRRRTRRIAALAAMVAGLLAAALLALLFTSTVRVEPQAGSEALDGLESEREITADGEDPR
jgi:serine/threonine protein phosphatase PrpC